MNYFRYEVRFFVFIIFIILDSNILSANKIKSFNRYHYSELLDISLTPTEYKLNEKGCFTDAGSWMGFTIPQNNKWMNGFCGPFSIGEHFSFALSSVVVKLDGLEALKPDSMKYYPGEVYMGSSLNSEHIIQRMNFVDSSTALLQIETNSKRKILLTGEGWNKDVHLSVHGSTLVAKHVNGEVITITFPTHMILTCDEKNYMAKATKPSKKLFVAISFYNQEKDVVLGNKYVTKILKSPKSFVNATKARWDEYIKKTVRDDMKSDYDRIAVKSVMTLISNWRSSRGDLLHDGLMPSHAAGNFLGFWAWDSWRFSAALSRFAPELAKNNIRAMFDYQLPDGMVIDCIFTNSKWNNARDSKPPLVCWAINEILMQTNDISFVKEMYPKILSYYKWWFEKRDHDNNGICEFGSTDGTLEAAAWESGMDNAIRFDSTQMLKNASDAWSMNQENVDLNAYLALECRLLKKFAVLIGEKFDAPDHSDKIAKFFFNDKKGWFCDRKIGTNEFIEDLGCEGYTPFWTKIASDAQMKRALKLFMDTTKFSTYIPFPTAAADNPKCDPEGYWRGPIWLDQTYFAIKGLRNYGYHDLADYYTVQVFERCKGLIGNLPIYENYGTHTGEPLRASHFSWSAAHLLMLYEDYGKKVLSN